ncbi:hypothetical protein BX600DRAFT_514030 [Xylariales sp. PMI_506]|nr:hypothetical protein BX600DRAFT_514030 [Xylariales sp. PMI_506]
MSNWGADEFMSGWDRTYVSTNLKSGASSYDAGFLKELHSKLSSDAVLGPISTEILVVASIALGRADLAGKWFDDVTQDSTPEASQKLFQRVREGITCIYPFVGVPACMPACYGMIGVLERKGESYGDTTRLRKKWMEESDLEKGAQLRSRIYSTAGNSKIFSLMDRYFPDLYNASTAFTWGYLISKANEDVFEMTQSHLLVLSVILALGANRQMGSHIKASIGIGNPVGSIEVLVSVVSDLAVWAGRPFQSPDIPALAEQVKQSVNSQ